MKKNIVYIGNSASMSGLTMTTMDTLSRDLESLGYVVKKSKSMQNKAFRLLAMLQCVFLNRNWADIVLIDTYSTLNFYYATTVASLCRNFNIPYITILHGGNLPARLKQSPKKSQKLFKNAYLTIAPSAYLVSAFKKEGYKTPTYIPNTIILKNYPFLQREKISAKLLWVRSFSKIYNPMLALQIVEKLNSLNIEVSLTMVGPEKDGSKAICEQYALKNNLPVKFTGLLSKSEWIKLSTEHDLFINTTNFDNMPVSVIEAMALGMPIISTNVGGVGYIIEHGKNAMLVPPNTADKFVETIVSLLEHPENVHALSKNARKYSEQFDWKQVKEYWIRILDSLT